MADKSFDAVIVGGGNKALILAMYLTKYGKMEVGIFEDRHELGGGWSCEEPAPGFIGNTCSMSHVADYHIPVYQDFPEWESYGARYGHTDVAFSTIFKEDHSAVTMYSGYPDADPSQEKSAREIARFSEKDAKTHLYLWDKYVKYWRPALQEWMFSPAKPIGEPDALEKLFTNPDAGVDPLWLYQSPLQVYFDLFDNTEMQLFYARSAQSLGFQNDLALSGFGAILLLIFWLNHNYVIGGTHQLAHASQRVILENGGSVFTNTPVEEVMVKNQKARGIRLSDGTEIEARKVVITNTDPYQLCFQLLDKDLVPAAIRKKVKNLSRDWITINWYTWALREPPRYKAEDFNPDIWRSMWTCLADRDPRTFIVESSERKLHEWPAKTNIGVAYHYDPLRAPPGLEFTILTEGFVVPSFSLSEEEWKEKEKLFAEDVIKTIHDYAPNITWDSVIDYLPVTPNYTAHQCKNYAPAGNWCVIDNIPSQFGKLRPIPELADHRVPTVNNLYATGSAWHPFGSAHSAQGYNCYKVIAEDLGLAKPWEKEGRPF